MRTHSPGTQAGPVNALLSAGCPVGKAFIDRIPSRN